MENNPDYESVEYHLVYAELIHVARHRGTLTYQELAHIVGLPLSVNFMGKRIGELLGTIAQNEVSHNRPMLSALAVNTAGKPGSSFLPWAKKLDLFRDDDNDVAFWKKPMQSLL